MGLALIAALDLDGVIGSGGRLPWRLPADLARFRRLTLGGAVVMGRRTFESMGRPLPGRRNLVLSRSGRAWPGVEVFPAFDDALVAVGEAVPTWIIGGASVYEAALPRARRLCLTVVQGHVPGDVYFPALVPEDYRLLHREECPADGENHWGHSYLELVPAPLAPDAPPLPAPFPGALALTPR